MVQEAGAGTGSSWGWGLGVAGAEAACVLGLQVQTSQGIGVEATEAVIPRSKLPSEAQEDGLLHTPSQAMGAWGSTPHSGLALAAARGRGNKVPALPPSLSKSQSLASPLQTPLLRSWLSLLPLSMPQPHTTPNSPLTLTKAEKGRQGMDKRLHIDTTQPRLSPRGLRLIGKEPHMGTRSLARLFEFLFDKHRGNVLVDAVAQAPANLFFFFIKGNPRITTQNG